MQFTNLGRSGLIVSRLCLGTDNFGTQTSEEDSHGILDDAHEAGINLVDTSNVYGWREGEGYTEQIIGRWFAQGGGRRDRTVLATKLYGVMDPWPNNAYASALSIRRACEASLKRLQTDYIDIYQLHHVDRSTPWDEVWEAMQLLQQQGKIVYVGTSNHAGWHLAKGQEAANRRNFTGIVSEQTIYNLLERTAELEVLPACLDYGIGMMPWAPLSSGLLGGILRRQQADDLGKPLSGANIAGHRKRRFERLERHREQIQQYEDLCDELGHDPADVALAWTLQQPGVSATLVGPRTSGQLQSSLGALDVVLDEAALARLDVIFPGPGPAPEAYAW